MPRCVAKKPDGSACKAFSLIDDKDGFCLFHSRSDRAKAIKAKRILLTKEDMVLELQRQLKKVKREEDTLERSREIRQIVMLIMQLKGEKVVPTEEENTFDQKLKQWKDRQ